MESQAKVVVPGTGGSTQNPSRTHGSSPETARFISDRTPLGVGRAGTDQFFSLFRELNSWQRGRGPWQGAGPPPAGWLRRSGTTRTQAAWGGARPPLPLVLLGQRGGRTSGRGHARHEACAVAASSPGGNTARAFAVAPQRREEHFKDGSRLCRKEQRPDDGNEGPPLWKDGSGGQSVCSGGPAAGLSGTAPVLRFPQAPENRVGSWDRRGDH